MPNIVKTEIEDQNITIGTVALKNGNTSQLASVSTAGALHTNLAQVAGATVATGNGTAATSIRVALPTDGTGTVSLNGYSFVNHAASDTVTVKSGAGVLHAIIVNTKGTVASIITVYDNTAGSGTKIAIIDSLTLSGTFQYDINFATGLTLVITGTAAPDITVSYR